jgi:ABC-type multidrug transport system ATPase subunit
MTTNGTPAIDVVGLRKSYGDLRVLDGVDLQIEAGTVFALLGPNGAGKTTTVQILSTLIEALTRGEPGLLGKCRSAGVPRPSDRVVLSRAQRRPCRLASLSANSDA